MVSEYLIFADETGNPSMKGVDPDHPIFALVFVIIKRTDYAEFAKNWIALKLRYFNNPLLPLHSYDIRNPGGQFAVLKNIGVRKAFLTELNEVVSQTPFVVIAGGIQKNRLSKNFDRMQLYDIALGLCLERAQAFLNQINTNVSKTPIVFESRGKKEDWELKQEFDAILLGETEKQRTHGMFSHVTELLAEFQSAPKSHAIVGLELADIVAYPIGRHIASPQTSSTAFDTIKKKIYNFKRTPTDGFRIFPF